MAILVGIDEAGFGPILGPLVVSSSTFSLPHRLVKADLWQILRKSVGNKRKRLAGRLLVTDSKKAYSKSLGIKHLQRTVLACLRCLYKQPVTLTELLTLNPFIHLCSTSAKMRAGHFLVSASVLKSANFLLSYKPIIW